MESGGGDNSSICVYARIRPSVRQDAPTFTSPRSTSSPRASSPMTALTSTSTSRSTGQQQLKRVMSPQPSMKSVGITSPTLTARHNFTGIRIDDERAGERATDSKRRDILGGGKIVYPTRLTFDEKRIYVEDKDEEGPAALTFTMDAIFGPNTRQRDVWAEVGIQHVNSVLQGYNSTIFAYGRTGSGKTHTIVGPTSTRYTADWRFDDLDREAGNASDVEAVDSELGMMPRALHSLLNAMQGLRSDTHFTMRFACAEIYNRSLFDLVAEPPTGTPNGAGASVGSAPGYGEKVEVKDGRMTTNAADRLTWHDIDCRGGHEEDAMAAAQILMQRANAARAHASTAGNTDSSRSHVLYMCRVASIATDGACRDAVLSIVDLAGSESLDTTDRGAVARESETKAINSSLHTLTRVVHAYATAPPGKKPAHVPWRESLLTMMLRDSIGGNCKTSIVVALSTDEDQLSHSYKSCQFARLARGVQNNARQNAFFDPSNVIAALRTQVAELQDALCKKDEELAEAQGQTTLSQLVDVVAVWLEGGEGREEPRLNKAIGDLLSDWIDAYIAATAPESPTHDVLAGQLVFLARAITHYASKPSPVSTAVSSAVASPRGSPPALMPSPKTASMASISGAVTPRGSANPSPAVRALSVPVGGTPESAPPLHTRRAAAPVDPRSAAESTLTQDTLSWSTRAIEALHGEEDGPWRKALEDALAHVGQKVAADAAAAGSASSPTVRGLAARRNSSTGSPVLVTDTSYLPRLPDAAFSLWYWQASESGPKQYFPVSVGAAIDAAYNHPKLRAVKMDAARACTLVAPTTVETAGQEILPPQGSIIPVNLSETPEDEGTPLSTLLTRAVPRSGTDGLPAFVSSLLDPVAGTQVCLATGQTRRIHREAHVLMQGDLFKRQRRSSGRVVRTCRLTFNKFVQLAASSAREGSGEAHPPSHFASPSEYAAYMEEYAVAKVLCDFTASGVVHRADMVERGGPKSDWREFVLTSRDASSGAVTYKSLAASSSYEAHEWVRLINLAASRTVDVMPGDGARAFPASPTGFGAAAFGSASPTAASEAGSVPTSSYTQDVLVEQLVTHCALHTHHRTAGIGASPPDALGNNAESVMPSIDQVNLTLPFDPPFLRAEDSSNMFFHASSPPLLFAVARDDTEYINMAESVVSSIEDCDAVADVALTTTAGKRDFEALLNEKAVPCIKIVYPAAILSLVLMVMNRRRTVTSGFTMVGRAYFIARNRGEALQVGQQGLLTTRPYTPRLCATPEDALAAHAGVLTSVRRKVGGKLLLPEARNVSMVVCAVAFTIPREGASPPTEAATVTTTASAASMTANKTPTTARRTMLVHDPLAEMASGTSLAKALSRDPTRKCILCAFPAFIVNINIEESAPVGSV